MALLPILRAVREWLADYGYLLGFFFMTPGGALLLVALLLYLRESLA
jgi:hypothetical protein